MLPLWDDSELYGKVIVASKVPLPNYRPDLDDKRPQREVSPCNPMARSIFNRTLKCNSKVMMDRTSKVIENTDINSSDMNESARK